MNSTGDEISDDELDECVGTIETTMNLICGAATRISCTTKRTRQNGPARG